MVWLLVLSLDLKLEDGWDLELGNYLYRGGGWSYRITIFQREGVGKKKKILGRILWEEYRSKELEIGGFG